MQEVLTLLLPLLILVILMIMVDALFSALGWLVEIIVEAVRNY